MLFDNKQASNSTASTCKKFKTMSFLGLFLVLLAAATAAASATGTAAKPSSQCKFLDGIYTSVLRRIFNKGFHKELSTEIELMLTTTILPDRCRLVVEETVPKGMYVDPDQLRDISEFTGLRTFVNAKVDVEKPEYESEAFRLFIFRELEIQANLRVTKVEFPIHLRYHKPREQTDLEKKRGEEPVAIVKMQNPRLFLSCDGGMEDEENVAWRCPDRAVTTFCDSSGTAKCEYIQIPYKINVNAVEVSVPVGNMGHTTRVVGVTTMIVSGATVYLMVAIFRKTESRPKRD